MSAHSWNCDFERLPAPAVGEPDDRECYCPTDEERKTRECGHLVDVECGCDEW